MSNFMHKVKDAMTDRDSRDSRDADRGYNAPGQDNYGSSDAPMNTDTNTRADTNPTGRGSNPFGSNRSGEGMGRQAKYNDSQNVGEPGTTRGNQNTGRSGPDPYAQTRAGGASNAGPHDSAMANKMDPRVDSDMDHRANPARTEGERPNVTHAQGFDPSNTHLRQQQQQQQPQQVQQPGMQQSQQQQQPGMQGFDNHKSSEEKYQKATQEHRAHTQPGTSGADQMTSQDDYSASTQENKSQSTTSHAAPCQTNVGAESGGMGDNAQQMGGTAQPMGGNAQQGYGGNAQPSFGGNAAAGGSSFGGDTGAGGRSGAQGQNADPLNKLDPRTTRANEQQNLAGNQRGY